MIKINIINTEKSIKELKRFKKTKEKTYINNEFYENAFNIPYDYIIKQLKKGNLENIQKYIEKYHILNNVLLLLVKKNIVNKKEADNFNWYKNYRSQKLKKADVIISNKINSFGDVIVYFMQNINNKY